jgi:hypothetical protein
MRKQLLTAAMCLSFAGLPAMMGCDDKVAEDKTVRTDPNTGKKTVDEKKVERTSDGGTKTTEEHKTANP